MLQGNQKRLVAIIIWLALGWACFCLSGCSHPNRLEWDYGRSVRNNTAQQLVNPTAGLKDTPPAVGLPPEVGKNVFKRYSDSFKKEKKSTPSLLLQEKP